MQIINFHGVGQPQRDLEPGEARFWLATDQFRSILDRIADHPDRNKLAITFDDGNRSDLTIAVPELLQRGLSACFFVLTGRLDQPGSLSRDDITRLQACGMGVGSHGVSHADFKSTPYANLARELRESKAVLQDICDTEIGRLAIPFGRYNGAVLQAISEAGYRSAFTSDGGSARPDSFVQPRRSIRNDMTVLEIESALSGQLPPLKRLRRAVSMRLKQLA